MWSIPNTITLSIFGSTLRINLYPVANRPDPGMWSTPNTVTIVISIQFLDRHYGSICTVYEKICNRLRIAIRSGIFDLDHFGSRRLNVVHTRYALDLHPFVLCIPLLPCPIVSFVILANQKRDFFDRDIVLNRFTSKLIIASPQPSPALTTDMCW